MPYNQFHYPECNARRATISLRTGWCSCKSRYWNELGDTPKVIKKLCMLIKFMKINY